MSLALALTAAMIAASDTCDHALTVDLWTTQDAKGTFMLGLFDNKKDFLKRAIAETQVAVGQDGKAQATFKGLCPGTYAVSVYQDMDDNGKMKTGFFGIPKEPVGTSNNPKPRMGPPRFKHASFDISSSPHQITIRVGKAK